MKLPRSTTVFLVLLLFMLLAVEQVFALPVVTTMIFLVQQPMLSEEESCVVAGLLGIVVAVIYHIPFAAGMTIYLLAVLMSRRLLQRAHVQVRDTVVAVLVCSALAILTNVDFTREQVIQFMVYIGVVVVVLRLWISRRAFMTQRFRR